MRLLDLFCGEGGAAEGYRRAGFTTIVGVDLKDTRKRYPGTFVQDDALAYLIECGLAPKERRVLRKGRKPRSSVITTKPRGAPCGTPAAYRRHLRNGEPVDEQCRRAHNAENAKYPKRGDRKASA